MALLEWVLAGFGFAVGLALAMDLIERVARYTRTWLYRLEHKRRVKYLKELEASIVGRLDGPTAK